MKLDSDEYKPVSIYEVDKDKTDQYIWSSLACGDTMYMMIGKANSLSYASIKTTYLFPISKFNLSTKNTTLTHGSSTKAVLSASYKKNSASDAEIKWEVLRPGASEF